MFSSRRTTFFFLNLEAICDFVGIGFGGVRPANHPGHGALQRYLSRRVDHLADLGPDRGRHPCATQPLSTGQTVPTWQHDR